MGKAKWPGGNPRWRLVGKFEDRKAAEYARSLPMADGFDTVIRGNPQARCWRWIVYRARTEPRAVAEVRPKKNRAGDGFRSQFKREPNRDPLDLFDLTSDCRVGFRIHRGFALLRRSGGWG